MNKKNLFLILPLVVTGSALVGCNMLSPKEPEKPVVPVEHHVKWLTPVGSPTLAFYTEADNKNWTSTSAPAKEIPAAFTANTHDAIVFDGVAGLNILNKNKDKSDFVLYDYINEGSFYVVSTKHEKGEEFKPEYKVNAFVEKGNAARAFRKLAVEKWAWYENEKQAIEKVTYEPGITQIVQNMLKNDVYDYYIVAEPVLTTIQGKFKMMNEANKDKPEYVEKKVNVIYDLQKEYGSVFPAAALFVNKKSMEAHPESMNVFLEQFKENRTAVAKGDEALFNTLSKYVKDEGEAEFTKRFGFKSFNMVKATQAGAKNKLAYLEKSFDNKKMASEFNKWLGGEAFADDLFFSPAKESK